MKRFYEEVSVARLADGWQVLLDGRGVKTPGKAAQLLPSEALAEALADEWRAQGEELDPNAMPMRDLADYAIDHVAGQQATVAQKLIAYAETDTLAYRADPDDPVFARQQQVWEPIMAAFESELNVRIPRVAGIAHAQLTDDTRNVLTSRIEALAHCQLAALEMLTSLAGSLCVGWRALSTPDNATALFDAANLEQDIQAEEWGWDHDAAEARSAKSSAFVMAARFAQLSAEA